VAVLIHQVLAERRRNGRRVPVSAALAVAVTALLGWLDAGIQALLTSRVYDLRGEAEPIGTIDLVQDSEERSISVRSLVRAQSRPFPPFLIH
jgi:hypothetical protein